MPRETKAQREKREAAEKEVTEAPDTATETPAEPEPDAMIVLRTETPEGVVWSVERLMGGVTIDQVPTGLRLAANRVDALLGLDKR